MKTVRDLVESAKRRTVLLCLWVLGLAYVMSLTSPSIWVNAPIALLMIAIARSLSDEVQIRWKGGQTSRSVSGTRVTGRYRRRSTKDLRPDAAASVEKIYEQWRLRIEAPEVESALEEFTNSIVKEWVTNLWFDSVSTDQEFPVELRNLINSVFAELSLRVKRINLINLLTHDIVDLVANHLELFRRTQARVGADTLGILSSEERDENIKQAMSAAGELHPALVSTASENRVLHKLIGGLIPLILKGDDSKCKVAQSLSRELLACVVMRPVMNLLSPAFINTLIETTAAQSQSRAAAAAADSSKAAAAKRVPDRPPIRRETSVANLEMVAVSPSAKVGREEVGGSGRLKPSSSEISLSKMGKSSSGKEDKGDNDSPVLLLEGPAESLAVAKKLERKGVSGNYGNQAPKGEPKENWAQLLEVVNQRKTLALAPDHLDNLWTKGRNYKKRDSKPGGKGADTSVSKDQSSPTPPVVEPVIPQAKSRSEVDANKKRTELVELRGPSSQNSIDSSVSMSETSLPPVDFKAPKAVEAEAAPPRVRRSRSIGAELDGWQGIQSLVNAEEGPGLGPGFDPDIELKNQLQVDVVGVHFEKGGSKTFAVYSIFVTDLQNRTWEVQRRFRNFEQLHRSLKDQSYYNLSLPAKRFLSSNLDNSFIRQRCALLDKYLKDLLAIPSVAELHEVWDFLSANSQTYAFDDTTSMFKTLTTNVDDAVDDMFRQFRGEAKPAPTPSPTEAPKLVMMGSSMSPTFSHLPIPERKGLRQNIWEEEELENGIPQHLELGWHPEFDLQNTAPPGSGPSVSNQTYLGHKRETKEEQSMSEGLSPVGSLAGSDLAEDDKLAIPQDWSPPKVSVPLLNLVDVIFELQGRGWIRRQVFWIAKQVLQLGMGDALDDFLLDKIQQLRREEVVAGGVRLLHKKLWPDGIFLTKHPSRQTNTSQESSFETRLEAARRAGIVREIILERAPATLVSLIGRKQYQRCAKDLYFFLQSTVCLKQLTYSLLELLLLTTFPELRDVVLEVRNL